MCKQPAKKPVQALLSNSVRMSCPPTVAAAGPPVLAAVWKVAKAGCARTGWIKRMVRAESSIIVPAVAAFRCWEAPATICGRELGGETDSSGDSAWKAEEDEDDASKGAKEQRKEEWGVEALRRLRWVHEKEEKQSLEESNGGSEGIGERGEKGFRRTLEGIGEYE